jgi:hypothetical protein
MRLIIILEDTMISIDGEPITGCDVSWVPEFVGDITGVLQKVHAVQWYDDHGEIELVTRDSNIEITELGVFEQAITVHAERKAILEAEAEAAELQQKQEEQELFYEVGDIDIDQLLAELESEDDNENVGIAST